MGGHGRRLDDAPRSWAGRFRTALLQVCLLLVCCCKQRHSPPKHRTGICEISHSGKYSSLKRLAAQVNRTNLHSHFLTRRGAQRSVTGIQTSWTSILLLVAPLVANKLYIPPENRQQAALNSRICGLPMDFHHSESALVADTPRTDMMTTLSCWYCDGSSSFALRTHLVMYIWNECAASVKMAAWAGRAAPNDIFLSLGRRAPRTPRREAGASSPLEQQSHHPVSQALLPTREDTPGSAARCMQRQIPAPRRDLCNDKDCWAERSWRSWARRAAGPLPHSCFICCCF